MKILVRLGADLTVKSDRIRAQFVTRMLANMRAAFATAGVKAEIQREWSRLFVETEDRRALEVIGHIFGVASYSPVAYECAATMDDILRVGMQAFGALVSGKSFAVRARRIGEHPFTSQDIATRLGAVLRPLSARVDLARPEVEAYVEVRNDVVYFFSGSVRGPGGLPLGVSGRVVCLISGGFDSAVAAWLMQKRGLEMEYVFCNIAGAAYERSVLGLAKHLASEWGHGTRPKLHVLDFEPLTRAIRATVRPSHAQVILKRLFYRAACQIAAATGATALLTGECIGQVSSQTLRNLCTIEAVADRPVLRPLVGWDKEEITVLARRIGTFELSARIQEYCQLVPDKPVTACRPEAAEREEQDLDLTLVDKAVATRRTLVLTELSATDLVMPYLFTTEVPQDAVVVDCRPPPAYDAWHYAGALNCEVHELLTDFRRFDKQRTYVLYCPVGLQSAVAAERLQKAGFLAYSFRGGVAALRSYAATGAEG